jgi:hypothetical protein
MIQARFSVVEDELEDIPERPVSEALGNDT